MRAFALSYRGNANVHDASKDKLCAFNIADEEGDKTMYIKNFCKQMAENACKTDSVRSCFVFLGLSTNDDYFNCRANSE
jgi:hypothetical protein